MTIFRPEGDVEQQLVDLLNSGLTFEDNFDVAIIEFTADGADQSIEHGLGRIPFGFFPVRFFQDTFSPV